MYLSDTLLSLDIDSDQEQLAAVDISFGPFPLDYAHTIEDRFPGSFNFDGETAVVQYPLGGEVDSALDHLEASRRLGLLRPVAVSFYSALLECSISYMLKARVHNVVLCDLIRKLTHPNPAQRTPPEDAIKHRYFEPLQTLQLG